MLTRLLEWLVMPPVSLLLCILGGAALARVSRGRRASLRRVGVGVAAMGAAGLVLAGVPWVSYLLLAPLQRHAAISPDAARIDADAIVVLAADVDCDPPEWGPDQPGGLSLMRCRYGARLSARTGTALLVTGGVLRPDRRPVSHVLRDFIEDELGVDVRWTEDRAVNTRQNARFTAELLAPLGVRRVAVVTHAWHMPRALAAFECAGLEAIPAPMGAATSPSPALTGLIPRMRAYRDTGWAVHEWIGLLWYRWTGPRDPIPALRAER